MMYPHLTKKLLQWFWHSKSVWLVLVFIVTFFNRLPSTAIISCDVDEGAYLTISQNLLRGAVPYKTLWDHKGPLLFPIYSPIIWLFGGDVVPLRIFQTFYVITSMLFIYLICRMFTDGKLSLLPPLLYGIFLNSAYIEGICIQAEPAMMLPLIIATFFFVKYMLKGGGNGALFLCGLFSAISILIKPTAIFMVLAFPMWLFYKKLTQSDFPIISFFKDTLNLIGGGLVVFSLVFSYFGINDAIKDFIWAYFSFNQTISQVSMQERLIPMANMVWGSIVSRHDVLTIGASLCLLFLLLRIDYSKEQKSMAFFVFILAFFSFVGTNWRGTMYYHYYMVMGLSYSLIVGFVLSLIKIDEIRGNLLVNILIVSLLVTSNIPQSISEFDSKYNRYKHDPTYQIGYYLANRTNPDDCIIVLNNQPVIYLIAERKPAMKYFTYMFQTTYDLPERRNITISELNMNRPVYIVDGGVSYIDEFRSKYYYLETELYGSKLYRLNTTIL